MLEINSLLLTKASPQSSECLYCPRPNQQSQLILFTCLKKSKRSSTRWWPFLPDPSGIITQLKDCHPKGSPYQVSSKLFLISNPRIAHPRHNSLCNPLSKDLSMILTLGNSPRLLDLNASILFSPFINHLYLSYNTISMYSSILGYCCHWAPYCKVYQISNQFSMIYVLQLACPIITYFANPMSLRKPYHAKHIN